MREMAESGDFLIPRLMDEVYYDKPPVMHSRGRPHAGFECTQPVSCPFPVRLRGTNQYARGYGLGRMLGGRQVGLWERLSLLAIPGFWIMARVARPVKWGISWH